MKTSWNEAQNFDLTRVPSQLQSAQHEINNLRLLNVCLQSTLFRLQSQLIEYLPEEIKRHETKGKLRLSDDQTRRKISPQQFSFNELFDTIKTKFHSKSSNIDETFRLDKHQKQIESLHNLFSELNTIIHTEHHDRICQLYLTLEQTSQSVKQARQILDQTIQMHRTITRKRLYRQMIFVLIIATFLSVIVLVITISIRRR